MFPAAGSFAWINSIGIGLVRSYRRRLREVAPASAGLDAVAAFAPLSAVIPTPWVDRFRAGRLKVVRAAAE